jgi:hypothetical protein
MTTVESRRGSTAHNDARMEAGGFHHGTREVETQSSGPANGSRTQGAGSRGNSPARWQFHRNGRRKGQEIITAIRRRLYVKLERLGRGNWELSGRARGFSGHISSLNKRRPGQIECHEVQAGVCPAARVHLQVHLRLHCARLSSICTRPQQAPASPSKPQQAPRASP